MKLCICSIVNKYFQFSIFVQNLSGKKIEEFRKLKQNFPDKNLNRQTINTPSNLKDYTLNYKRPQ